MKPREAFKVCFDGSANFMTPTVLGYGTTPSGRVWELSSGSGFEPGSTIYGVTVINADGTRVDHKDDPSSGGFESEITARRYIRELS